MSRPVSRGRRPALLLALALAVLKFPSRAAEPAAPALPPAAQRPVSFVKDIQPLLADRCYSCHGPDKQKGQLRWDSKASAFQNGDHGPRIVPGDSTRSRVIQLVAGLEPDTVMPPKGDRLTLEQIGVLRAWIDQGAIWPETATVQTDDKRNHWAFKTPTRPAVPVVKERRWPRNPIDNFVCARVEKDQLKPAPEADRATLIRRLSLDLTGLPPTLAEVDQFLSDRAPDAYQRLVERLLASPHYGELWGRHWLDVARYADTNGYEKDRPRSIWLYRDWVIEAFNRDLPYDQFIIEQLAGDLLPNPTTEQRVATGFLRNAMLNQEGGIEPEQFRVEALIDRMDTLGKAFLGLTINCCQCHNHKFDPFTQKEYYQLYAFLNEDDETFMEVPTQEQQQQRDAILSRVRDLEDTALHNTTNLAERMAAWEKNLPESTGDWVVLDPNEWLNFGTKFEKQWDLSMVGGGDLQKGDTMHLWIDTTLTNITGFRLEALTNANLMYGGPGETGHGSFLLKEFSVEAWPMENPTFTNKVKFRRALADAEAPGFGVTNAIDGKTDKGGWTPTLTPDGRNQNHCAVFECAEPIGFLGGTHLEITLHETFDSETNLDCHLLGSFRLSATTHAAPLSLDPLSPERRRWLAVAPDQRSPEQQRELFNVFRRSDPEFAELNKEIDQAWAKWPYPPTTMVLQTRAHPRVTHVFKRGDRLRPDEEVTAGVPAALHPFPAGAPRNRLGLAAWIADPRSPTTARVIVNRMWQAYFGQGLVTTPEDFGTRVEAPSHPELLDWLACELMDPTIQSADSTLHTAKSALPMNRGGDGLVPVEKMLPESSGDVAVPAPAGGSDASPISGSKLPTSPRWSLKHIHRLIVNSATYRQSSKVVPEVYVKDPYDRLLERAPRVRVEGEVVQDVALSVSGLLNPKIGGPSVFPPIPGNVGDTSYGGFSWSETKGEDRYRRGLYTFWKRSLPFPALSAFDVPSGETACPRRVRSNTPLQALTTLNEKTFVEAAQALALRVLKEGGADDPSRVRYAFRLCTSRQPTPSELDLLLKFWSEQYAHFENNTAGAVKVAAPDLVNLPADVNLHKVAA